MPQVVVGVNEKAHQALTVKAITEGKSVAVVVQDIVGEFLGMNAAASHGRPKLGWLCVEPLSMGGSTRSKHKTQEEAAAACQGGCLVVSADAWPPKTGK